MTGALFKVSLATPHLLPVSVDFTVEGISAAIGEDFQPLSGTLSFAPGETVKTLNVSIDGDLIDEDEETFRVNLTNAINAIIGDGEGIGTILDNDRPTPIPTISIDSVSVVEGDLSSTEAELTIGLSSPSSNPVTVDYQTLEVSATAGEDFEPIEGTLTFDSGETQKRIQVSILGDLIDEDEETFNLILSNPSGAILENHLGTLTIIDNDNSAVNQSPNAQEDKTLIVFQESQETPLAIAAPTDADGDNLTITVEEIPPPHAGVVLSTDGTSVSLGQQLSIAQLTSLVFSPLSEIIGNAGRFRYTVSDGRGGSDSQTISFFITPVIEPISLVENSDFEAIESRAISIPSTSSVLHFKIEHLNFDTTSQNTIRDAFEVALVDARGKSLVHTLSTAKEAFYNATEGQSITFSPGVTQSDRTVTVNLTGLTPG